MTTLRTSIDVSLSVPVAVKTDDGKEASRNSLMLKRPKLRHAKKLAALVGPNLVKAIMQGDDEEIDKEAFAKEIASMAVDFNLLEELTALIADICGEQKAFIDDIDLADLKAIGTAFLDFFPALQSLDLSKLRQTSRVSTAGAQENSTN